MIRARQRRHVYIAGCLEERNRAIDAACQVGAAGHLVVSTWHANPHATRGGEGVLSHGARREIADTNILLVDTSDAMLVLADARCRGTLLELGAAIAMKLDTYGPILAVGDPLAFTLMASHPFVEWVATVREAIAKLDPLPWTPARIA